MLSLLARRIFKFKKKDFALQDTEVKIKLSH
jgi:hypothetical protein